MERTAINPVKQIMQEHNGNVYGFPIGVLAENVVEDPEHRFLTDEEKANLMWKDDSFNDGKVAFTQAAKRENIKTGETFKILFGKIKKYLADLKGAAWCDTTDSINSGEDVDVATRKALKEVNEKLGGMSLKREGTDIFIEYQDGADTVRKKLNDRAVTELPLSMVAANDSPEITAGPIDFTDQLFFKVIYDYNTSNREALHIALYNGDEVYLHKYLAKGYSEGHLTLQENLETIVDVMGVTGSCYMRLWADNSPNSGGGVDGLGNFVVKSMALYS